jgi:multidrug resistance efflux pump
VALPFTQTLRAIGEDRPNRSSVGLLVALGFLAIWMTWFLVGRVSIHEASMAARIEVSQTAHRVDAPVGARIVALPVTLGQRVQAGDIVVQLEAESERKALGEESARLAAVEREIEATNRVLVALGRTIHEDRSVAALAGDEGKARQRQAEIEARIATEEAMRATQLRDAGAIADLEVLRAIAEADRRNAGKRALEIDVSKQLQAGRARETDTLARVEEIRRQIVVLEGRRATSSAVIEKLEQAIATRVLRAPVAGQVADVTPVTVGAYVREGQQILSIVPAGRLRVIAEFRPRDAIGRVRPGHQATVRLEGYPSTQFGALDAVVRDVGAEPRNGMVRVELELVSSPPGLHPVHGMPGSADVTVESAAPAQIVWRAIGAALAQRTSRPGTT